MKPAIISSVLFVIGLLFNPTTLLSEPISAADIVHQLDDEPLDFSVLHTYSELVDELYAIEQQSNGLFDVGPLIINENNGGLIDIDFSFNGTTLREAVVNTVRSDSVPSQGNSDSSKVGYSNFDRALMAVKFGFGPKKVVYITQQHGNEFIATEAAFDFLRAILSQSSSEIVAMQQQLTLLMIVRANPDGGEPDPLRCQMGAPLITLGFRNFDCAFYRFNIDKTAGHKETDDSFRGAVGVGYNLNRYHIPNLDAPIRPVENQAMVAAMLAFQPNYIMDLHGDMPKVTCPLAPDTVAEVEPDLLYDIACASAEGTTLNDVSIRDMAEFIGNNDIKAQRWNGMIINNLGHLGMQVGVHRQFGESEEIINTAGEYSILTYDGEPVHTMLLEQKTLSQIADPLVTSLDFNYLIPRPNLEFALNQVLGKQNFQKGKLYSQAIMMEGLKVIMNEAFSLPGDGGYSAIALDSGFIYEGSPLTTFALGLSNPGPYLFPLCLFEPCLGDDH